MNSGLVWRVEVRRSTFHRGRPETNNQCHGAAERLRQGGRSLFPCSDSLRSEVMLERTLPVRILLGTSPHVRRGRAQMIVRF